MFLFGHRAIPMIAFHGVSCIYTYVTQDEKRWLSHYFEKNEIFTSLDSPFSWLSAGVFAFSIRRCNCEISSETLTCLVPHNSPKNAI